MFMWLGGGATLLLVTCGEVRNFFFFFSLGSNIRKLLLCVLYRQNVPWPKKTSLCCQRGTCLWSLQCMKHTTTELTGETYWKNMMTRKKNRQIIIKTRFPGMKSDQKCTTQLGRITPRSWRFFCIENKAFVFNLFMQFDDSETGLFTYGCYF